ncbi:TIGR03943 family putative permease subunit [Microbacterium radiodurans]|uniref:TIGR03943 family protein n=1 Tax=Microbacterium radiodurans TaxID=661398 RepID=A0A5J5IU98_9MICO|nr:TIGR03943 family protein [Microbacterium radiodurans]KAA9089159.1 TIGR03943 family protein [Microbacterium radiodurans]
MSRSSALLTRLFGVGLAAALAAVTVVLAATGRIGLYINPESAWFAIGMAVLALIGAVVSFALPLGAEADHAHDHGDAHDHDLGDAHDHGVAHGHVDGGMRRARRAAPVSPLRRPAPDRLRLVLGAAAAGTGGVIATGLVAVVLVTPPATLSAELAMSRDTGAPPLFQGADSIALATTGDTAAFGVGEWASVFATATNPEAFEGDEISLTGFVTPGADGGFGLTRLIITHCVIDAQPASIPIGGATQASPQTGDWVTVTGVIRDRDGRLVVEATGVQTIDEPEDPYEY